MSLISYKTPPIVSTGGSGTKTQPIYEGVPTVETVQPAQENGFFGWLDRLGGALGDAAGRAVDVVADNWINDLNESNRPAVKTPDSTPVKADNQLPVQKTFFEQNQQYIIWGGVALVGVAALYFAMKGKK